MDAILDGEAPAAILDRAKAAKFDERMACIREEATGSEYVVSKGVKGIADHAFEECYKLNKVNIPARVMRIGDHTFRWWDKELTIYSPAGSYAIQYAKKMGFRYRSKKEK